MPTACGPPAAAPPRTPTPTTREDTGLTGSNPSRRIKSHFLWRQRPSDLFLKRQIEQIAASIRKFGFNNPVLINDDGQIVAGHGRVEAAKLLGLAAVPTLRLSHLSPAEQRAYVLADNKLAENAGWDRELLAVELQGLIDLDFEVELTGFDILRSTLFLKMPTRRRPRGVVPKTALPSPRPDSSVTQAGDLWLLGKHRVLCGSALKDSDYGRLLDREKAEFVFTDPPYNVRIAGNVCGKGSVHHREFAMASGEMSKQSFIDFLTTTFRHLALRTAQMDRSTTFVWIGVTSKRLWPPATARTQI